VERLFAYGFLAPPTIFIVLSLLGGLMALRWRRVGVALAFASSLCLYAAATPALSSCLLRQVESALPQNVDLAAGQAIVVLGAGVRPGNGADIPDRLDSLSVERVVLGAEANRALGLPLLVSGGLDPGAHIAEGTLMKAALASDFALPVAWSEDQSRTTWENAVDTARLLQPERLTTIVLVSHAWHLPRALWAFERAGFKALPWPAPRTTLRLSRIGDFLPALDALKDTFYALHEMIGAVYYRLRY
jgi:uncharacterized SAM-binding protein YcdF (DUF218 family)